MMNSKEQISTAQAKRNLATNKLDKNHDIPLLGYGIGAVEIVRTLGDQQYVRLPVIGNSTNESDELVHWLVSSPDKGRPGIKGDSFGFLKSGSSVNISKILNQIRMTNIDIEDKNHQHTQLLERSSKLLLGKGQQIFSALEVKKSEGSSNYSTELVIPELLRDIMPVEHPHRKIALARKLGLIAVYYVGMKNKLV